MPNRSISENLVPDLVSPAIAAMLRLFSARHGPRPGRISGRIIAIFRREIRLRDRETCQIIVIFCAAARSCFIDQAAHGISNAATEIDCDADQSRHCRPDRLAQATAPASGDLKRGRNDGEGSRCQRRSKTRPLGGAKVGHLAPQAGNGGRA